MTKRIFTSIILASVIVLLASGGLTMGVLYNHFGNQLEEELRTEAEFLSIAVENEGMGAFDSIPSEAERITYIDTDGTVLFDNRSNADDMENHLDREEIQEAMEDGSGMAVRESDTLSQRTLYYALRLADGTVLRVSSTQYSLPGLLGGMIQPLLIILILMLILAGFLASRLAKNIVNPLNRLDLDHPEENQTYEEVAPLLTKINRQQKSLQAEIAVAKRQQEEFSIITDNMEEGFLVIDSHTEVLSYNSSALRLLGAREQDARQSVLALNRSESFQRTVEKVLGGQHVISNQEFQGITCQVAANPVFQEGKVTGAVILILDVTEKMKGEQMRREFTANVSHELKTPLTSISGFAEIINDGFVKPEDTKKFAGRIFKEAQRLITLVNDVIKISQLDEGKLPYEKEEVDLYEAVRETFLRIEDHAKAEGVHLYLYGPHIKSNTVKTILDEIIYNLCDNGIKYNKKGGSLTVTISQEGEKPVVTVEDTGIGISEEDQKRIFERFYRVDKSHSKAIGGTGLGLAIARNAVIVHRGSIKVYSNVGEGTTFTVRIPLIYATS